MADVALCILFVEEAFVWESDATLLILACTSHLQLWAIENYICHDHVAKPNMRRGRIFRLLVCRQSLWASTYTCLMARFSEDIMIDMSY